MSRMFAVNKCSQKEKYILDKQVADCGFSDLSLYSMRIFVCNICSISISHTVSDGATRTLVLSTERAQQN